LRHGITRIDSKVHQGLIDMAWVNTRAGPRAFKIQFDQNTPTQKPCQKRRHAINSTIERNNAWLHCLTACEGQKLAHQTRATAGAIQDLAQIFRRSAILTPRESGFRCRADGGQKIIEIMGNATGKPAHCFQPRRFFQLRLPAPARGNIKHAQQCACFATQGPAMHLHRRISWLIRDGEPRFNGWRHGWSGQGDADDPAYRFLACWRE
jgi:hypothetical protein